MAGQGNVLPDEFLRVWKEWNIPAMVLFSLLIQTVLILTGNRRKYSNQNRLRLVLWLAYLLADWVALVSLSLISNFRASDEDYHKKDEATVELAKPTSTQPVPESYTVRAFWAPFLFLHLGGPDTITAYSLEDNQTWQRTLVTVSGQILIAVYIALHAWSAHVLNYLSIPIFVAGVIKSAERICATMRASSERLRKSMLPPPDPGPNYAKYMDEYSSKRAEGFKVSSDSIIDAPAVGHHVHSFPANHFVPHVANLQEAYSFFEVFKCLFADLILTIHDIVNSQSFFQSRSSAEAFHAIEIELSFMYDLLYTKAVVIYSAAGRFCRLVTVTCVVSVLVIFSTVHKKFEQPKKDIAISYVLLVGAVFHEIYAIVSMLASDQTMVWLSKHKTGPIHLLHKPLSWVKNKRWCNKIAQLSLISLCLREDRAENSYVHVAIPAELKELVFQQLLKKSRSASEDPVAFKKLCSHRGEWVLKNERLHERLGWSVDGVEFDHSVLLWHVATDLCYNAEEESSKDSDSALRPNHREMSKMLSEYMAYVLVIRPYMFPDGIGQIRYQDTCAEAREFFKERKSTTGGGKEAAVRALMKVSTEILPSQVKGDRSKSVLFDGCRLGKCLLMSVEAERRWELLSHVWVEMFCYAGNCCRRYHHAQQLRRGGELLTHVWLLMAHLGITEQFQISDGHARIKLIVQ